LGIFLIIAIPGPILGFFFGRSADIFSIAALAFGLIFTGYILFHKDASGRTLSYHRSGIVPVRRIHISAFRTELAQLNQPLIRE